MFPLPNPRRFSLLARCSLSLEDFRLSYMALSSCVRVSQDRSQEQLHIELLIHLRPQRPRLLDLALAHS